MSPTENDDATYRGGTHLRESALVSIAAPTGKAIFAILHAEMARDSCWVFWDGMEMPQNSGFVTNALACVARQLRIGRFLVASAVIEKDLATTNA